MARPEMVADLIAVWFEVTKARRKLVDEQILAWHQEAEGYKIRHVLASLPDTVKGAAHCGGSSGCNWIARPNKPLVPPKILCARCM